MGGLAMLAIRILIRLLFDGKNNNESLTSLNLSNAESDREDGSSSFEVIADAEPSVDALFDEFFETYYRNRWSTEDVLRFLRIFLTKTCYSAPEGSVELATYFFARISKDRVELIPAYEKELSEVSGRGAEVLLEILRQADGHRTRDFLEVCANDDNYSGIHDSLKKALELPFPQFQSALLRSASQNMLGDSKFKWAGPGDPMSHKGFMSTWRPQEAADLRQRFRARGSTMTRRRGARGPMSAV